MSKIKTIIRLFDIASDRGPQINMINMIKTKFNTTDCEEFNILFTEALFSVFISETSISCSQTNNMIEFAARSLCMLTENNSKDGFSGMYLLSHFFQICLHRVQCKNTIFRRRLCLFLNYLLKFMSNKMVLPVEIRDIATSILFDLLNSDASAKVRVEAVRPLHWLQYPDNHNCEIVKKLIHHMTRHPCIKVKASIIKEIALNNIVIDVMLKHTLISIHTSVRKEAYKRFLEYPFDRLSPNQRLKIVEHGLKDPSNNNKALIKKHLLVKWFENCNNDFEIFLKHMDLKNVSLCDQIMTILFESLDDSQALELKNNFFNFNYQLPDFNQLTMEKIFLWKCMGKYLKLTNSDRNVDEECIEVFLPDLVKFSDYIRDYYFNYITSNNKELIVIQLLDLASIFVMDDFGAHSLNTLCYDLIMDSNTSIKLMEPVTMLLNLTHENGSDILKYIKQILNDFQTQVIGTLHLIDKFGTQIFLKNKINKTTTQIENILKTESDSEELRILKINLQQMKKELEIINNALPIHEILLAKEASYILFKSFELVFQVQYTTKVSNERSLVTDVIQNIVDYLENSVDEIRMLSMRALFPHLMVDLDAAKVHIKKLFREISNHQVDKSLWMNMLFKLFLNYGLKSFNISDNIDTDYNNYNDITAENILSILTNFVDYEIEDKSFKLIIVKGFCDLMTFSKIEPINLISKFYIIWCRPPRPEILHIYKILTEFFTTYMRNNNSSSSTIAKCYVPVFKQIAEHKLTEKLNIDLNELSKTFRTFCKGILFKEKKMCINAHGELAGYILDYLFDENQAYSTILINTLYKLKINFECDNKLLNRLVSKLKQVINHFKHIKKDKKNMKNLKKIKRKFSSILQKENYYVRNPVNNELNDMEIDDEGSESTPSFNHTQRPSCSKTPEDLFSQEHIENASLSSDSDDYDYNEEQ